MVSFLKLAARNFLLVSSNRDICRQFYVYAPRRSFNFIDNNSMYLVDRQALPEVGPGIRCSMGNAVITGPNSYGKLNTHYVIHAVGPNYKKLKSLDAGDALLSSAYNSSLECAKTAKLEAVAFSLLSAGVFRGSRSVKEVLRIGMAAICKFGGYTELQEVHMCAFNENEADTLVEVAEEMGLEEIE